MSKSNKRVLVVLAIAISFCLGFFSNSLMDMDYSSEKQESDVSNQVPNEEGIPELETVTGIGGVFFKSKDPVTLNKWYETNLGMKIDEYGKQFEWKEVVTSDSSRMGSLQWSIFNESSDYFDPSKSSFMINYMVSDIDQLVIDLEKNNVVFIDSIADYSYGKFVHIMDPEGNKIELFEPNYDFKMPE